MQSLEKAVWNWMDNYPHEFTELQKNNSEELTKCCDTFFDLLDNFAESKMKHRHVIWPLQMMLLILTPKVLEEINNADSGAPCSPRHLKKKHFIDAIKKSLQSHGSSNKALVEAGVITCVKLCKAATYINVLDSNNVVFNVVQTVINDLKNLMFNVQKPFARGSQNLKEDVDLMIDCFLANFRINPHNNDTLRVCLNTNSPYIYHHVLVSALYRIITQPRLPWWPQIDVFYRNSAELRAMFTDSWNRVILYPHQPAKMIQSFELNPKVIRNAIRNKPTTEEAGFQKSLLLCMVRLIHADPMLFLNSQASHGAGADHRAGVSLELMNGLVSLVHQSGMPDVAQEAMDALKKLHQPEKIELWNPENPITTFWDISSQVLFSMSQKLIQHQILNYTEVLKWMRDILVCRNQFLLKHREYANVGSQIAICRQAHIKLEVVYFMYLWSIDMEAVLVAMSCFSLLCEEADIRGMSDEVTQATFLLPNYHVYQDLAQASTILTTGRAALQKRIMALLRKIESCTHGVWQAWEDTFMNWESSTKHLSQYPKTKDDLTGNQAEAFHRIGKRRASHHSTEHELEDQVAEWANMTGFLVALGGVCLQKKSPASNRSSDNSRGRVPGALQHSGCQDMQYCPVTQFLGHLLRLLVCPNEKFGAQIQKHVKELVGHEMSPSLYPILFDQIKIIVEKFFDQTGQVIVNETNTQFIEHIIFIMKNVLEAGASGKDQNQQQQGQGGANQNPQAENLGQTSIELMMLAIVNYVRHLDTTVHALHIKTRLCQLVEAMMVEYLTDW